MAACAYNGQFLREELDSVFSKYTLGKKEKEEEYLFLVFVVRNAILTGYSLYSA